MNNLYITKKLTGSYKSSGGRNGTGRVAFGRRGGGSFPRLIVSDNGRFLKNSFLIRNGFCFRKHNYFNVVDEIGNFGCYRATKGIFPNILVTAGYGAAIFVGNRLPIKFIPLGTQVSRVSCYTRGGVAQSRGLSALLLRRFSIYTVLRLPSGEERMVSSNKFRTIGSVSSFYKAKISKRGDNRKIGFRPRTRGVSMNPVDHPHGGRTRRGRPPLTPWFKPTRGVKTRIKNWPIWVIKPRRSLIFLE